MKEWHRGGGGEDEPHAQAPHGRPRNAVYTAGLSLAFALVSVALAWERRPVWSTACYVFSLVLKPFGSVLILPWMAWIGNWRWTAWALIWLVASFVLQLTVPWQSTML